MASTAQTPPNGQSIIVGGFGVIWRKSKTAPQKACEKSGNPQKTAIFITRPLHHNSLITPTKQQNITPSRPSRHHHHASSRLPAITSSCHTAILTNRRVMLMRVMSDAVPNPPPGYPLKRNKHISGVKPLQTHGFLPISIFTYLFTLTILTSRCIIMT